MSALALALLLAQAAAPAPATQWERLGGDAESVLLLDPASVRREGNSVRLRWRTEYAHENPGDGMRALVVEAVVDCPGRSFAFRRIEGYRADGSLIQAFDIGPDEEPGRPHSFGAGEEPVHRRICGP